MGVTIELPPELESELTAEAARRRLPLRDYVLQLLATAQLPEKRPKNGKELVAYWEAEGLIGTRPDIKDSAKHARKLRAQAERRSRK